MTTQNDEEVKETSEDDEQDVLTADDLDDPDSDELAPGAEVKDPENEPEDEEKDTPDKSSNDDKPDKGEEPEKEPEPQVEESESPVVTEKKAPAPVAGESPREAALRLEVQRVKKALRAERGTKLFKDADAALGTSATELSAEDKKTLESFDPDQVANMEKLIAISAKKMGFVKKDEFSKTTYQEKSQDILDTFLEAHPELDKENDKGDILWKQFQENIKLYKAPPNPKDWKTIFQKAHKDIFGIQTDDKDLKKIAAQQEKTKVASHGAAASKPGSKPVAKAPAVDQELKDLVKSGALKGFSDEELKELGL